MTENYRYVDLPALRVVVLVNLAPADTHGLDGKQNLVGEDFRNGLLAQLDGLLSDCVVHYRGHAGIRFGHSFLNSECG